MFHVYFNYIINSNKKSGKTVKFLRAGGGEHINRKLLMNEYCKLGPEILKKDIKHFKNLRLFNLPPLPRAKKTQKPKNLLPFTATM